MRVVIDTNILVSGVFWKGPPAAVLEAWRDGRIEIVLSPAILDEYQRVARELSRRFPLVDLNPIIELLTFNARMVSDSSLPVAVCSDPDDDKFIHCALVAHAAALVSGDRAVLSLGPRCGRVAIISVSDACVRYCR